MYDLMSLFHFPSNSSDILDRKSILDVINVIADNLYYAACVSIIFTSARECVSMCVFVTFNEYEKKSLNEAPQYVSSSMLLI
jgi:hypothetical protein